MNAADDNDTTTGDDAATQSDSENTTPVSSTTSDDGSSADPGVDTSTNATADTNADATADSANASDVAKPGTEYVKKVLEGSEALTKVSEAVAILADAEAFLGVAEPLGGVLTIIVMIVNVWEALELPERTCSYQGLCYGLMYTALGMGDPQPNPGWPGADAAPEGAAHFAEGLAEAKKRLGNGQEGVKSKNLLLLAIAKDKEQKVINQLWQKAVPDDDHLLRMFTVEWPNVGPNG